MENTFPPCSFTTFPKTPEEKRACLKEFIEQYESIKQHCTVDNQSKVLHQFYLHVARNTGYCFSDAWLKYIFRDRLAYAERQHQPFELFSCCYAHRLISAHEERIGPKNPQFLHQVYTFTVEVLHTRETQPLCSVLSNNIKFTKCFAQLLLCIEPQFQPLLCRIIDTEAPIYTTTKTLTYLVCLSRFRNCIFSDDYFQSRVNGFLKINRPFSPLFFQLCEKELAMAKNRRLRWSSQKRRRDDMMDLEFQEPFKRPLSSVAPI